MSTSVPLDVVARSAPVGSLKSRSLTRPLTLEARERAKACARSESLSRGSAGFDLPSSSESESSPTSPEAPAAPLVPAAPPLRPLRNPGFFRGRLVCTTSTMADGAAAPPSPACGGGEALSTRCESAGSSSTPLLCVSAVTGFGCSSTLASDPHERDAA